MKKLLSLCLIFVLIFTSIPFSTVTAETTSLTYTNQSAVLKAAEKAVAEDEDGITNASVASVSGLSNSAMESWLQLWMNSNLTPVLNQLSNLSQAMDLGYVPSNDAGANAVLNGDYRQQALNLWAEVEYARFALEDARYSIQQNLYTYEDEDSTDLQKAEAYYRIYTGVQSVNSMKAQVRSSAAGWEETAKNLTASINSCFNGWQEMNAWLIEAAADGENGLLLTRDDKDETIVVYVLSDKEIGLNVRDENNAPLQGAKLVVTSRDNPEYSVTAFSDAEGRAIVNISDFPLNEQDYLHVDAVLTMDGRKTWRSSGRYIQGGKLLAVNIRMEPEDGNPYVEGISFRDSDVINQDDTIYVTPYNTIDHDITVYLNPCGKSGQIIVHYTEDGAEKQYTKSFSASDRQVVLSRAWCKNLTVDSSISVELKCGSLSSSETLSLSVEEALVEKPVEESIDMLSADTIFSGLTTDIKFHDKPWLSSLNISVNVPLGVLQKITPKLEMTPDGRYSVGINYTAKFKGSNNWETVTNNMAAMAESYLVKHQSMLENMMKTGTMKASSGKKWGTVSGGSLTMGYAAILSGKANRDKEKGNYTFSSKASIGFMPRFVYNYTKYFLAWAIPVFVGAEGGISSSLGFQAKSSYTSDNIMAFLNLKSFFQNISFDAFIAKVAPFVRIFCGAGIRGFLGVSLEGFFQFIFNWVLQGSGDKLDFSIKGDISLYGYLFFVTLKQVIFADTLYNKNIFDRRYNNEQADEEDSIGQKMLNSIFAAADEADEADDTQTGSLSPLLQATTTETETNQVMEGTLDSLTAGKYFITLTRDKDNKIWLNACNKNSSSGLDVHTEISTLRGSGKKFDYSQYYIYDAKITQVYCDPFHVLALNLFAARYDEDVWVEVEQEDGSVVKTRQPGKTYAMHAMIAVRDGSSFSFYQLSSQMNDQGMCYSGVLSGLSSMKVYEWEDQESFGMKHEVYTAFCGFDSTKKCTVMYENHDSIDWDSLSLDAVNQDTVDWDTLDWSGCCNAQTFDSSTYDLTLAAQALGVEILSIDTLELMRVAREGRGCQGILVMFTDTEMKKRLIIWHPGKKQLYTFQDGDIEGMIPLRQLDLGWEGNAAAEEDEDGEAWDQNAGMVLLVRKNEQGSYDLQRYLFTIERGTFEATACETYYLSIPTPEVSSSTPIGDRQYLLGWLEAGATMDSDPTWLINGIQLKYDRYNRLIITKPYSMATFDSNQYSPTKVNFTGLRLTSNINGLSGMLTARTEDAAHIVSFIVPQALFAQIESSMVLTPLVEQCMPSEVLFTLSNQGNTPIESAKMKFTNADNPDWYVLAEIDFEEPEESSVEIHEGTGVLTLTGLKAVCEYSSTMTNDADEVNCIDGNGQANKICYDAFLPGDTRSYRLVFTIPKEWGTGEKTIECMVTDYKAKAFLDETFGQYSTWEIFEQSAQIVNLSTGTKARLTSSDKASKSFYLKAHTEDGSAVLSNIYTVNAADTHNGKMLLTADDGDDDSLVNTSGLTSFRVCSDANAALLTSDVSIPDACLLTEASVSLKDGEPMVLLQIRNNSWEDLTKIKVYAYPEDGENPSAVYSLNPSYQLNQSHVLQAEIPLSSLAGGETADWLTLSVQGTNPEGKTVESTNLCQVQMETPLSILTQPEDATITAYGQKATFSVNANKDHDSLTFQWQYSTNGGTSWNDFEGETESQLTFGKKKTSGVPHTSSKEYENCLFRCVVSNSGGETLTSDSAALLFKIVPSTADEASPLLWAGIACMAGVAFLLLIAFRKKRKLG